MFTFNCLCGGVELHSVHYFLRHAPWLADHRPGDVRRFIGRGGCRWQGQAAGSFSVSLLHAGVSDSLIDKQGDNGLNSVSLSTNIVSGKDECIAVFHAPPFDLSGAVFGTKLEIGKIVLVYVAATTTSEVRDAERVLQRLPPQRNPLDMGTAKRMFHKQNPKIELSQPQEPSSLYFENQILKAETVRVAEQLTKVTIRIQEELITSGSPHVGVDPRTGCIKTSQADAHNTQMPCGLG